MGNTVCRFYLGRGIIFLNWAALGPLTPDRPGFSQGSIGFLLTSSSVDLTSALQQSLLRPPLQAFDQQALTSHVLRLRQAHRGENSRRNVSQYTSAALEAPVFRCVGNDEWHPVSG
jgi:hypothetical protein